MFDMKNSVFIFLILIVALSLLGATDANCAPEKYAVLFNGGYQTSSNYAAYLNDTRQMYDVLLNIYEFPEENIFIFQSDGQDPADDCRFIDSGNNPYYVNSPWDLDGDSDNDIEAGAATSTNLFAKFDDLSNTMDSDDIFYFWATDHGQDTADDPPDYKSGLCGWGSTSFSDADFASSVAGFNVDTEMYVFGQCYSGGFIDNLTGENRMVVTAADHDESSWSYYYTPTQEYAWGSYINDDTDGSTFLNKWAKGLSGPADADEDGNISIDEAFTYAEANDICGPIYDRGDPPNPPIEYLEHPQYDDYSDIGGLVSMNGWIGGSVPEPLSLFPGLILAAYLVFGVRILPKR